MQFPTLTQDSKSLEKPARVKVEVSLNRSDQISVGCTIVPLCRRCSLPAKGSFTILKRAKQNILDQGRGRESTFGRDRTGRRLDVQDCMWRSAFEQEQY